MPRFIVFSSDAAPDRSTSCRLSLGVVILAGDSLQSILKPIHDHADRHALAIVELNTECTAAVVAAELGHTTFRGHPGLYEVQNITKTVRITAVVVQLRVRSSRFIKSCDGEGSSYKGIKSVHPRRLNSKRRTFEVFEKLSVSLR